MNTQKLSYFPPQQRQGGYKNPYSQNYQDSLNLYFKVLESKPSGFARYMPLGMFFLYRSIQADIYIINWLESVCFLTGGFFQFICALLGLLVIKLRGKKIVWMFHNIHPHQGDNFMSKTLQDKLYTHANLIISHSKEACIYAKRKARCEVIYRCHPIKAIETKGTYTVSPCDVFIWGEILPYKGIVEFLNFINKNKTNIKIKIIGKCNDKALDAAIKSQCTTLITYENRRASFTELASIIQNSKYILFPYIGDCVSSSGALIDSIAMGGKVMGPNRGAFSDLASEKVCITYNSYEELLELLAQPPQIHEKDITDFFNKNSWDSFGKFIYNSIC